MKECDKQSKKWWSFNIKQSQCKRTKRWKGVIFSVQCKFVPFIFIVNVFPKTSSQNFHYTSSKRKIVCAGSSGLIIILILILIIIIIIIRESVVEILTAYLVFILFYFILLFLNSWKKLLNFRGWQFFYWNEMFLIRINLLTLSKLNYVLFKSTGIVNGVLNE